MKIEEAKKKWCPFIEAGCGIDSCMAWRWKKEKKHTTDEVHRKSYTEIDSTTDGYCALIEGEK